MKELELDFVWLDAATSGDLPLPSYASSGAAGMDVAAALHEPLALAPGSIALVPSGFAVAIPPGYELQVRPRSGLAIKHGVTVVNAPGTIDADYRGEIKVGLINLGPATYQIQRGDRIAQLVLAQVSQARIRVVQELDATCRGSGGFGHSGR
ncbi:MAG: dUTP diphosphatase [Desulfobulbaceae bacterium]|nr:dUTP diphosphatase [Desulfobulbaceae bacterium]